MRILPSMRKETARQRREEDELWSAVRGASQNSGHQHRAGAPAEAGHDASHSSPNELFSRYCRAALRQRDRENAIAAQESFLPTHDRLMQTIAASRELAPETPPVVTNVRHQVWPQGWLLGSPRHPRLLASFKAAIMVACLAGAVAVGRASAYREVPYLPMGEMISRYDLRMRDTQAVDLPGTDVRQVEEMVNRGSKMRVILPYPEKIGARLLGVRQEDVDGIQTVESQFESGGKRFVLFQTWAPRHALRFVTEKRVGKQTFLLRELFGYRMVAWRQHDSVLAVVSKQDWSESLALAERMRSATVL